MRKTVLITNAAGSLGRSTTLALGWAGHAVYAGLNSLFGVSYAALLEAIEETWIDLRVIDINMFSQASIDAAVAHVICETGRLDALVHNSGYSTLAEPLNVEALACDDRNLTSPLSVNRAAIAQFVWL